jgi:cell division protein FtsQ
MPIVLIAALIAGGLAGAALWPGFDPQQVVVTGNHRVARDEILARAEIAPEVSIWLQSMGAVRRRIDAIPYVATAAVYRVPPAGIRIAVTEREPFAILRSGSDEAIVDSSLRVLQPLAGASGLPVLVLRRDATLTPGAFVAGRDAAELRDAYEALASHRAAASEVAYDRFGGLVVTLRGGLQLLLGSPSDIAAKLGLADAIIAQVVNGRRRVAAIDLRAPSAPVLVYR